MMLRDAMLHQGNWLFRWRGYLPLVLLPTLIPVAANSGTIHRVLGPGLEDSWEVFAQVIAFIGLGIRIMVVGYSGPGTSGRNTQEQRADSLNRTGLYSIVRNPLYLGNFLIIIGVAMMLMVWWFILLVSLAFFAYYERIIYAEEVFLEEKFGDQYREWAAVTPVIIPNPWLWRTPAQGFSLRKVLRNEYSGLYVIIAFSTLVHILCDVIGEGETLTYWMNDDWTWFLYFVLGTVTYLTLRSTKRHTTLLNVTG